MVLQRTDIFCLCPGKEICCTMGWKISSAISLMDVNFSQFSGSWVFLWIIIHLSDAIAICSLYIFKGVFCLVNQWLMIVSIFTVSMRWTCQPIPLFMHHSASLHSCSHLIMSGKYILQRFGFWCLLTCWLAICAVSAHQPLSRTERQASDFKSNSSLGLASGIYRSVWVIVQYQEILESISNKCVTCCPGIWSDIWYCGRKKSQHIVVVFWRLLWLEQVICSHCFFYMPVKVAIKYVCLQTWPSYPPPARRHIRLSDRCHKSKNRRR